MILQVRGIMCFWISVPFLKKKKKKGAVYISKTQPNISKNYFKAHLNFAMFKR